MKLISINIECNKHHKTVLDFIKKENPDIICLQELLEEDYGFFKKELNMSSVYKEWTYMVKTSHPDLVGKKHGVAIFSNNIIDSGYNFYIGKEENLHRPFKEIVLNEKLQENTAFVWAVVKGEKGDLFKIITTHIPVTNEGESTPYQLMVVDTLIKTLNNFGEFILCGDMNAPRGNETFTRLAKKYKDNIPFEYKTSIDQNLHRVKGLQYMIDGLFTTPRYKITGVVLKDGISDHMAVIANIDIIYD